MNKNNYVAYISAYTHGHQHGIRIYDVDVKNGRLYEKDKIAITNSSYITLSKDERHLYSITDMGVEAYAINDDGSLRTVNKASINGMRGCYLSTDYRNEWLFVAGYHDGKITVLKLMEDGSIGDIADEVYLKGLGSIAERNFRPHVNCVKVTRDNKYLLAADLGMDHVNIYRFDSMRGKISLIDVMRSEVESAPRHFKFSKDGKYLYIVHELKNYIDVYSFSSDNSIPYFEKIQNISTLNNYHAGGSAASALNFSSDFKYLISSNAGDNSVVIYEVNQQSGLLTKSLCLPVSGSYPKDVALFPDNNHLVSLNHESGSLSFFTVDIKNGLLIQNGKSLQIDKPNCIVFHKL